MYYRLAVVTLKAPPLRDRPEDILPLAEHFARKFSQQCGRRIAGISPQARAYLRSHSWPGNVRELENAIERAVVLGVEETILPEDLPETVREQRSPEISATLYEEAVESAKKQVVLRAFEQAGYEHDRAAKLLGLHPNYLHRLIRALDLRETLKNARRVEQDFNSSFHSKSIVDTIENLSRHGHSQWGGPPGRPWKTVTQAWPCGTSRQASTPVLHGDDDLPDLRVRLHIPVGLYDFA